MKHSIFISLLLYPMIYMAQVYPWSDILEVNDNASNGFTRPRIGVNASGDAVIAWGKKTDQDVFVSVQSGNSFGTDQKVNPNGMSVFAQEWAGPELAVSGNLVYVAFKAQPENQGLPYVCISTDGGLTFSDTVSVSNNNWTRFPKPAIDPNGKPYVAFMEFDSGFVDPHYAVATSNNQGASFLPSVIATSLAPGEACDCCPADIQSNAQQTAMLFRNNDNNLRDIWLSKSSDNGATFDKALDVDKNNWMINSCPASAPDGMFSNDSLIVVWMSGASGASKVYIASVDTGLNSIGRNALLDPNALAVANQNHPKIAGNGDTIGVVWRESYQGKSFIKCILSTTGIEGILNNSIDTINNLDDLFQFNPDIAYANKKFHVTWSNNTKQKVVYRSVSADQLSGMSTHKIEESDYILFPNPASNELSLHFESGHAVVDLKILETSGRVVWRQNNFDLNNRISINKLTPGKYILQIQRNESITNIHFVKD